MSIVLAAWNRGVPPSAVSWYTVLNGWNCVPVRAYRRSNGTTAWTAGMAASVRRSR